MFGLSPQDSNEESNLEVSRSNFFLVFVGNTLVFIFSIQLPHEILLTDNQPVESISRNFNIESNVRQYLLIKP
jgi:hypothetical protein